MREIAYLFVALAVHVLVNGCVAERMREDHMELIKGNYSLSSFVWENEDIPTSSLSPSEILSAEIYQSDGRWFFDSTFPEMDFEGNIDYRRCIIPLNWNTALGIYEFDFSSGAVPKRITEASLKGGAVTISSCDAVEMFGHGRFMERNIHFKYVWEKEAR